MKFDKILDYAIMGAQKEVEELKDLAYKFKEVGDTSYALELIERAKKAVENLDELRAMDKKHWERHRKKHYSPDPLIELIRKELQK